MTDRQRYWTDVLLYWAVALTVLALFVLAAVQ